MIGSANFIPLSSSYCTVTVVSVQYCSDLAELSPTAAGEAVWGVVQ